MSGMQIKENIHHSTLYEQQFKAIFIQPSTTSSFKRIFLFRWDFVFQSESYFQYNNYRYDQFVETEKKSWTEVIIY